MRFAMHACLGLWLQVLLLLPLPAYAAFDEKPRWVGVLRAGYSTLSNSSTQDGGWSASGGLSFQIWNWFAISPEAGYQDWNTGDRPGSEADPGVESALWNTSVGLVG